MLRDLTKKIPGAPDFFYGDFVNSYIAIRNGIDNTPETEEEWLSIEELARNILQPVRNSFGKISISSGYRCPRLNTAVGGSTDSNHLRGQAADLNPEPTFSLFQVLEWIHTSLEYKELIAEYFPNGWVHAAYEKGNNVRALKLKDASHNYTIVDIEYIRKIYGTKG